jgi:hypothetical protein|tara:strand:+ start:2851 stop:3330 length:480 start_codon:yes stop_codon:yes gene_type:complete
MATLTANRSANKLIPAHAAGLRMTMLTNVIDFATVEATDGITLGSTDTYQLIGVPKGFVVTAAGFEILTAETTNTTAKVSLGDGGGTTRYTIATLINGTAGDYTGVPVDITYQYTADDTIDLLGSVAAPTDGKLRVWVVGFDVNDVGSTADTRDANTWS